MMMYGQLSLFSEELNEYFFLIQPDQKTEKEVKHYKHIMNSSIHLSNENLWSVPHMSLFKWTTGAGMDDYIIQKSERALKNKGSFQVKLDGLDIYHHGIKKSLVLKVKNPQPIEVVNRSLTSEFKFRPHKIRPHITIARSIPVNDFNKLSHSLINQFDYKGEFTCSKITILKKVVGQDQRYITLHETELN